MAKEAKEIKPYKKNCFWRHGPYKTIKIVEHEYNGKWDNLPKVEKGGRLHISLEAKNYKVKRIFVIQQCETCGKVLVRSSSSSMRA